MCSYWGQGERERKREGKRETKEFCCLWRITKARKDKSTQLEHPEGGS